MEFFFVFYHKIITKISYARQRIPNGQTSLVETVLSPVCSGLEISTATGSPLVLAGWTNHSSCQVPLTYKLPPLCIVYVPEQVF
jgi:hypothetical protein